MTPATARPERFDVTVAVEGVSTKDGIQHGSDAKSASSAFYRASNGEFAQFSAPARYSRNGQAALSRQNVTAQAIDLPLRAPV
jgi:hypothetical protein